MLGSTLVSWSQSHTLNKHMGEPLGVPDVFLQALSAVRHALLQVGVS